MNQDNWNQGRRRSLWVTTSWTLWHDSSRDLCDLGAAHIKLKSLETADLSELPTFEEGVLFATYKYLTKRLKHASCGDCDACLVPNNTASATCQSCKRKLAKDDWVCPKKCEQSAFCDQCHELLLVPRVKAIAEWMNEGAGNGNGVLVLDESHSAKMSTTVTHLGVCAAVEIQLHVYSALSFLYHFPSSQAHTNNITKMLMLIVWTRSC